MERESLWLGIRAMALVFLPHHLPGPLTYTQEHREGLAQGCAGPGLCPAEAVW